MMLLVLHLHLLLVKCLQQEVLARGQGMLAGAGLLALTWAAAAHLNPKEIYLNPPNQNFMLAA